MEYPVYFKFNVNILLCGILSKYYLMKLCKYCSSDKVPENWHPPPQKKPKPRSDLVCVVSINCTGKMSGVTSSLGKKPQQTTTKPPKAEPTAKTKIPHKSWLSVFWAVLLKSCTNCCTTFFPLAHSVHSLSPVLSAERNENFFFSLQTRSALTETLQAATHT